MQVRAFLYSVDFKLTGSLNGILLGPIVAIGDGTLTNLKVGQNVGIKWLADSCLDCENCREGIEATCSQAQCSGYSVDGTFQQYAVS